MKNKDLFEAIDNIDEKFVNDAGKYLGGYLDTDPVEVRPASKKTSPVKIAAPIAAALAVVCGIALVAKTQRPTTYSPGAAIDGEDTSSDIVDGDETSTPTDTDSENTSSDSGDTDETSTPTESDNSGYDPHEWEYLYDVDEKYLPVGFDGIKLTNADGHHYLEGDSPEEYVYGGFDPNFVYYAEPKGANYNSADNPEAFVEGFVSDNSATFQRIAKGDKYGDLTVGSWSYTTFARDAENSPNEAPIYYHSSSHLSLDGSLILDNAYIVKSEGVYFCVLRNGATPLPIISAITRDDGSYGVLRYEGNIEGLEYKTEIPPFPLILNPGQEKVLDEYFSENSYLKARVRVSEFIMSYYTQRPSQRPYWFRVVANVLGVQSGSAEPKEVAEFINTQTSASELKTALMEKFGFTDVVVVFNFSDLGIDVTLDTPVDPEDAPRWGEDELIKGMAVKVYDENGLCGIYTYGDGK